MDNGDVNNRDEVFTKKIKAGKRIYFFDVKVTRGNDHYITITESKRRSDGQGYEKHKIFLYKEDFMKFANGLQEVIQYVKEELMPDYDFNRYDDNFEQSYDLQSTQHTAYEDIENFEAFNNLTIIPNVDKNNPNTFFNDNNA